MALLLRQIGIILLGLNLINGPISVSAWINERGPDPRIKFIIEPPDVALITKNGPLLLPCSANITVIPNILKHEDDINDYDNGDEEEEEEDEDEGGENVNNEEDTNRTNNKDENMKKKELTHFIDLKADDTFINHDTINNEEYDDNDEDDTEQNISLNRHKRNSNRKNKHDINIIYTWYRNGIDISSLKTNGFRILHNGTLKIQFTTNSSGYYRCLANDTNTGAGSIISKETVVSSSYFGRVKIEQNITAIIGYPFVLNCPFSSTPAANFSWFFNKEPIFMNNINYDTKNRYLQLSNGSLLIKKITEIDNGRYRCMAVNNFFTKSQRNYTPMVNVVPINNHTIKYGLLPPLQSFYQKIKVGGILKLLCAAFNEEVKWTFTPRLSTIPVKLVNKTYEIQYLNLSKEQHDGYYRCFSGNESQVFDIRVMMPPVFLYTFMSINTLIAAKTKFNCSATGNPMPKITWYRNGIQIKNDYRINYDNYSLTIHTLEPEDEGLYQCFAKNDYSEIYTSGYLTVRKQKNLRLHKGAENVKCFPINHTTLLIKFESRDSFSMINYFLATNNTWISASPIENVSNSTIIINHNLLPLRIYTLYLRGFITQNVVSVEGNRRNEYLSLTRLSSPIRCATQGLVVYSNVFQNRIFIWWPHLDQIKPENLILQFWHNDSTNPTIFSDHIIGTHFSLDNLQTWEEIETNFVKIPAKTNIIYSNITEVNREKRSFNSRQIFESLESEKVVSKNLNETKTTKELNQSNVTITEVRIPGNVTGILIPNRNKIVMRVLASIYDNGVPFEQNLKYVEWNTFDLSMSNIRQILKLYVVSNEARSITISWNSLAIAEEKRCMKICYKNLGVDFIIRSEKKIDCVNIETGTSTYEILNLTPFTSYKIYMKSCDSKELLSDPVEVQTKVDIPGPVTQQRYSKTNGILLTWAPPINCNGQLLSYSIEWIANGKNKSANLNISNTSFKLPNVTSNDKVNISLRAVGTAGEGIPIYFDLTEDDQSFFNDSNKGNPILGIFIGVLASICCVAICICIRKCKRNCKKRNHNINRSLPIDPVSPIICNTDIHEMQTLISKTELPILIPNGREKHLIIVPVVENDKHDSLTNIATVDNISIKDGYLEHIPPAPDDPDIKSKIPVNGSVSQLHLNGNSINKSHLPRTQHSYSTNPSIKANGNLRITDNPQYLKKSNLNASILDNSQLKLLDTTIDSVNIDDDICIDLDLNESNLSSKPLQSSWNCRRPIIGPNG